MTVMAIPFPAIGPVAISIGPVSIRWYGIAYLLGLVLGWLYMRALLRDKELWLGAPPMRKEQADDFLLWATLGAVLGGRLGFVLFYEPYSFIADPARILAVWQGGMSFHGGLLGVGLAIWLFARRTGIPTLTLMDLSAAVVPFGLFFGRIANFINGEIYGRLTSMPWGVEFPQRVLLPGHAPGPRHPTQIYEAALEGVVMFALLRFLTHSSKALLHPGLTAGVFLMTYGSVRIFIEYFKEWKYVQIFSNFYLSNGVLYSIPMILLGLYWVMSAHRKAAAPVR